MQRPADGSRPQRANPAKSRRQQKNVEPQEWEWESEWEVGVRRCGPTNN